MQQTLCIVFALKDLVEMLFACAFENVTKCIVGSSGDGVRRNKTHNVEHEFLHDVCFAGTAL